MEEFEFCKYIEAAHLYIQNKNKKSIQHSGYKHIFDDEGINI